VIQRSSDLQIISFRVAHNEKETRIFSLFLYYTDE